MKNEDLNKRTKSFAHRCVKLALALPNTILGRHIKGQLIRCSTSVAANYRAACLGQSKASFIAKLSIVLEECDESCFWLEFIIEESLIKEDRIDTLLSEANELKAIFIASLKTSKKNKTK